MAIKLYILPFLVLALLFAGCVGSKRESNPLDPITTPFVLLAQTPMFDWETGHVTLKWQYVGRPVQKFKVLRHGFRPGSTIDLGWVDMPIVDDPFSTRSDIQPEQTFIDTTRLPAGERFAYTIEAIDAVSGVKQALGGLTLPGVAIEDVVMNLHTSSTRVTWHKPDMNTIGYDLIRQVDDGGPEVVFSTSDLSVLQFEDFELEGNRLYRYSLLSHLNNGTGRKSVDILRAVYLDDGQWVVPHNGIFLIHNGVSLASALLSLTVDASDVIWERRDVFGEVVERKSILGLEQRALDLNTLSFTLTDVVQSEVSGQTLLSRIVITALERDTPNILLQVWDWQREEMVLDAMSTWSVSETVSSIYSTVDGHGYVWVVAGNVMRVYDPEVRFVREFHLPFQSAVSGFVVGNGMLWMLLEDEAQLVYSQPIVHEMLGDVLMQWEDVVLPSSAQPVSLGVDPENGILILDRVIPQVLVYTFDGQPSVSWRGLDGLNVLDGATRFMSALNYIFVWDDLGLVRRFKKRHILGVNQ